jgi:hypothetical protein
VLTAFAWIVMLAMVSPMLHNALIRGYIITHPERPYTWLAATMALVSVIWMALNLTLLLREPGRLPRFVVGGVALVPICALTHPYFSPAIAAPLRWTIEGHYQWALVLALEVPLVLLAPWFAAIGLTRATDLRLTRKVLLGQVAYWTFFLSCMIIGLLPALNP